MTLSWGVHPVHTEDAHEFRRHGRSAPCESPASEELAKPGERLVITAGVPFGTPGATNILRIAYV